MIRVQYCRKPLKCSSVFTDQSRTREDRRLMRSSSKKRDGHLGTSLFLSVQCEKFLVFLVSVVNPATGHDQCLVERGDFEAEALLFAAAIHGQDARLDVDAHGGIVFT